MSKVNSITSLAQFRDLINSGKVIFIDFYAECGPCWQSSPTFDAQAEEHHEEGAVEFYKVDINAVPEVAKQLQIRSVPTFHVYKNGKAVDSPFIGSNKAALEAFVQSGLSLQ